VRPADLTTWEAVYFDGTVYRENQGGRYELIDRDNLRAFRLVCAGELLLELPCRDGRNGRSLVYRRRTVMRSDASGTIFVVGFVPLGPVVALDPERGRIYEERAFTYSDALFSPPVALDCEPWGKLGLFGVAHKSDALVGLR
jgi:hypothetical protein